MSNGLIPIIRPRETNIYSIFAKASPSRNFMRNPDAEGVDGHHNGFISCKMEGQSQRLTTRKTYFLRWKK